MRRASVVPRYVMARQALLLDFPMMLTRVILLNSNSRGLLVKLVFVLCRRHFRGLRRHRRVRAARTTGTGGRALSMAAVQAAGRSKAVATTHSFRESPRQTLKARSSRSAPRRIFGGDTKRSICFTIVRGAYLMANSRWTLTFDCPPFSPPVRAPAIARTHHCHQRKGQGPPLLGGTSCRPSNQW